MRVRIVAGEFGGRFLETPAGMKTHPMGERVRSAMFNSLGDVSGYRILDAFAGSGAIGLEAISRGADSCVFIDESSQASKIIKKNVASLNIEKSVSVINTTVNNWLSTSSTEKFDIIFADPPYYRPQFSTIKRLMGLLKPGGTMILSHTGSGEVPIQDEIVVVDNRRYGGAHLTYFRQVG